MENLLVSIVRTWLESQPSTMAYSKDDYAISAVRGSQD